MVYMFRLLLLNMNLPNRSYIDSFRYPMHMNLPNRMSSFRLRLPKTDRQDMHYMLLSLSLHMYLVHKFGK